MKFIRVLKAFDINERLSSAVANKSSTAPLENLLSQGADVNYRDDFRKATPLMWASAWGNLEAIKILLKHKAKINLKDDKGDTALMYAASKGQLDAVKLLLEAGANKDIMNEDYITAQTYADMYNHEEVSKLLETI